MNFSFKKNGFGLLVILCAFTVNGSAQTTWFADGYHGGVFGHYPKWQTQFLMDKIGEFPDWRVNLEIEPETFDSVKVWNEKTYQSFQTFVAANDHKTLEFTNPTYSQPYCYNISGESLIRQFSYGMNKLRTHFPNLQFTTYSVEEPCFTSALPFLLRSFGFKYAVLKNPDTCFGGYTAAFGGELVNWAGPDGTAMTTVPRYACEKLAEKSFWQTIAWNNSKEYADACFADGIKHPAGMCYQDAGWKNGPWLGNPKTISSKYTLWSDYVENIACKESALDWKFSQEEVLVSLMWGAQVLQKLAQEVRITENKLVQTEKLATMAKLSNQADWNQSAFDEAWRGLLLSQHHDCWIVPYNKLGSNRKTWAENVSLWTGRSNDLCDEMQSQLFQNQEGEIISVVNTLGFERSDVIFCPVSTQLKAGAFRLINQQGISIPYQLVPSQKDSSQTLLFKAMVPAMGSISYRMKRKKAGLTKSIVAKKLKDGSIEVESDLYQLVFNANKGGVITSLFDKKLKKQWVDPNAVNGLNELRGYLTDEKSFWSSMSTPVQLSIVEQGPVRCRIQVTGKVGDNPFTQTITITQGERRIDFRQEIDWKNNIHFGELMPEKDAPMTRKQYYDDRYKLHLLFPMALKTTEVYKNTPFDVCKSKLKNTFFNRWDSIKNNVILNWVDIHDSIANESLTLLTDHTTSYLQGENDPLGLTVQYSGSGLWGVNYDLKEKTEINYALYPHAGNWNDGNITFENARFNEPLVAVKSHKPSSLKSILELGDKSLVVSGLYFKGDKLYFRVYNEGKTGMKNLTLNFIPKNMVETDLDEKEITSSFKTSEADGETSVQLIMPSFSIRTFCIQIN